MEKFTGYDKRTDVGEIVHTRYQARAQNIDDVIEMLQGFKRNGARTVSISDGYYNHAFNARWEGVPNFDSPRHVLLRPVNNVPAFDGVTRETSGILEQANVGTGK